MPDPAALGGVLGGFREDSPPADKQAGTQDSSPRDHLAVTSTVGSSRSPGIHKFSSFSRPPARNHNYCVRK